MTHDRPPHKRARAWLALAVGLLAIAMFMFVVGPALSQVEPFRTIHAYVEAHDIDATPLFYTECEEFGPAVHHVRHAVHGARL